MMVRVFHALWVLKSWRVFPKFLWWVLGIVLLSLVPTQISIFNCEKIAIQPSVVALCNCSIHFSCLFESKEGKGGCFVWVLPKGDEYIFYSSIGVEHFL
ncbi:Uncharacterized protein TCM_018740 [Theobroma cacao]|uniref:Uncharacterized protein n=1 Tax=Theobroma cacao TaxID=3641 RepID=A0A061EF77_THECC|nr:Uncharacterized protein TCM_018740 [Theobroma cacao]